MNESETLHTFVFADLSGFTALTEAHGDEEAADIAADFYRRVRDVLSKHGAEAVKEIGDAVMIRCDDASTALTLAIDLIGDISRQHAFPSVRIGMHTGPAVRRGADWFGSTVNVAARVANRAGGGDVILTGATRRAAGDIEGIDLRKRGQHEFKNVSQPLMLYSASAATERAEAHRLVDPVCRMTIEPGREAGMLIHEGIEYRFCSLACAQRFAAGPARFL